MKNRSISTIIAIPCMDVIFVVIWIPALVLAVFFHWYGFVSLMTLLVVPLTIVSFSILMLKEQKDALREFHMKMNRHFGSFVLFLVTYQFFISTASICGYAEELFRRKRVWK